MPGFHQSVEGLETGCRMHYDPVLEDFFDLENCERCGTCLAGCPELGDRIDDPVEAVRGLIEGRPGTELLDRCSSCMTCSALCPNGCNPYGLILYRWFERNRERGYPVRAALVMPLEEDNAWHRVMARLPWNERSLLEGWGDLERPELRERSVFAGCNLQILPYLAGGTLFEGLPIFGSPELCCGEVYYRMGAFDKVKGISDRLTRFYAEAGFEKVICYCQACYNIMKNVLPNHFEASFDMEISYFGSLLEQMVLSGELPVRNRLRGLRVTIHDPCHSKLLGDDFRASPRRILEHMGCEVVEMKHNHEEALCCGLGHGAARFNPLDMARGIVARLREARATGAEHLVVYCNSCDLLFSVGTQVTPFIIPVYHVNELVQMALGEPLQRRNLSRARSMIAELFFRGAPKLVSGKRFRPVTETEG